MFKFFKRITCNHDWELLSFYTAGGKFISGCERTNYIKKCKKCLTLVESYVVGWHLTEDQLNKYIK